MGSLMLQEMGITLVNGVANALVSREEANIQKIMTKHHNTMTAITSAISHTQINRNAASVARQDSLARVSDQIVTMQDKEAALVSARAAGAQGNSVDGVMRSIDRAAAQKDYARDLQRKAADTNINDQRREVEMNRVSSTKVDVIPKGSGLLSALSVGMNLLDVYNQHTPGKNNPNM